MCPVSSRLNYSKGLSALCFKARKNIWFRAVNAFHNFIIEANDGKIKFKKSNVLKSF